MVDDRPYILGGASGVGCNCLIDTLRQKLPDIICNVVLVRHLLEQRHRDRPTRITSGDYLALDTYWEDIIDLLGEHNMDRRMQNFAARFQVVCADLTWIGHGDVLPGGPAGARRTRLHIARVNQNHFVPLIFRLGPLAARASAASMPGSSAASSG